MNKFNLLDCTLRDGGYITDWDFGNEVMVNIIKELIDANLDFVEVGYLNNKPYKEGSAIFNNIPQIANILPAERKNSIILAMADVAQFLPEDITPFTGKSIDGIRVVFYKHQIEEALVMCEAVKSHGYKLFVQPMVTIDYNVDEYMHLAERIAKLQPYAVSIVDSFGYMTKTDVRKYYRILDNILSSEVIIGYHSHNNMDLAFVTAQDILDYQTARRLVLDSSLYGMGRGAGNLHTELIANYYNALFGERFDIRKIMSALSRYIMPIHAEKKWGYSPYMFLTGYYHAHPNFATYLLELHPDVTVEQFEEYVRQIPREMMTKCRKPYVEELYQETIGKV